MVTYVLIPCSVEQMILRCLLLIVSSLRSASACVLLAVARIGLIGSAERGDFMLHGA